MSGKEHEGLGPIEAADARDTYRFGSKKGEIHMKVLIAVLTYKRESELERCLRAIESAARHVNVQVDVIIGDNDPSSVSTEPYIAGAVRLHVGLKTVAAGRQFLLAKGREQGYDYLAFVDDDEIVSPTWLEHMLTAAERYSCSAVAGPVSPLNISATKLPLHERARHPTGTVVQSAGAGNLLLNLRRVLHTDFDSQWKMHGGEDTDFTLRVSKNEGSIIWCDEGEVYEPVASYRLSRRWLIRRYFSNGRILCHAQRSTEPKVVFMRLPGRIMAVAVSSLRLLIMPLSPKAFRYFLDYGVRNIGFICEALIGK